MQYKILIYLLLIMNISSIEVSGQDVEIIIDPIFPVFKGGYNNFRAYRDKYFKPKADSLYAQCGLKDCDDNLGVEIEIDTLGNVGKVTIISTTMDREHTKILRDFALSFMKGTSGLWNCGYRQGKKATVPIWVTLYFGAPCEKD